MADEEDWRLRGQESYLRGATLLKKRYHAWSEDWEHDHCEFCWAKFMDPEFSPEHLQFINDNPDVLTEGYAVQDRAPDPSGDVLMGRIFANDQQAIQPKVVREGRADYWWVCPGCVRDFADRFQWVVIDDPTSRG